MLNLCFFRRGEFHRGSENWWPRMDARLLVLLDALRAMHGAPVAISDHPRALGRRDGDRSASQHNVDYTGGIVRAVDVMPAGSEDPAAVEAFIVAAVEVGITGIGVYPGWSPRPGVHLDTRPDRDVGDPATWGRIDGEYVLLETAMGELRRT